MNFLEYIYIIFSLLIPLMIFGMFWHLFHYFFTAREVLLDEEKGVHTIYTERCGGCFDGFNFTIPFVRLSIYNDFIVISYSDKILLKFKEIDEVKVKRRFIMAGVHIYHHKNGIPKDIILWSFNPNKIKKIIDSKLSSLNVSNLK